MRWHLYCRVVDNFGDVGVAWRLANDLAGRGEQVRLFIDDASALAWLAPARDERIELRAWSDAADAADVVVELFGAGLPDGADAAGGGHSVLINLEHLSAEAYVERSHGLPSPRRGAGGSMRTTWFYYPGFTERTGGLIREPGVLDRVASERRADGERRVCLFAYRNDAVDELLAALAERPTHLLVCPGPVAAQVAASLGPSLALGALRAELLPYVDQPGFDRLLRSCDLNFVRGEDSFVRALWAGVPFVWQLYPQDDGAHVAKLEAFLDRFVGSDLEAVRAAFRRWNGSGTADDWRALDPPLFAAWQQRCLAFRARLALQPDLTTQLIAYARSKR